MSTILVALVRIFASAACVATATDNIAAAAIVASGESANREANEADEPTSG